MCHLLVAAALLVTTITAQALDLQGHRGCRGLMPENTLPAFAAALTIGVTTLELDTAVTRDGVVVVSHDAILNPDITRGPDGQWLARADIAINSVTWAELQQYDVGRIRPDTAYARRFPGQQAIDGARIPRLTDVFALAHRAGNKSVRFNIETKISPEHPQRTLPPAEFARVLIDLIRAGQLESRVTIQSFDWRTLQVVQAEAPQIATVYLSAQQPWQDNIRAAETTSAWTAGLHVSRYSGSVSNMVQAAGGGVWSPYFGEVTRESVRAAQQAGLKVVVWTVNEPRDMTRMISLGVDGIITDYPDRLRRVAGKHSLPLPRPTPVTP
ncbi:MAG: glycerophosphodiester phosphodiesterase [Betaproteobacteria bacterium]|nr:glycerophosphodiester phosphodiesterase [Betaproteobacteria bacterium]MDH5343293.1 glycerophosphodiester phosphodiesterase [Betaproteobacteria bacterium]